MQERPGWFYTIQSVGYTLPFCCNCFVFLFFILQIVSNVDALQDIKDVYMYSMKVMVLWNIILNLVKIQIYSPYSQMLWQIVVLC